MELLPAILVAGVGIAPQKIQSEDKRQQIQDAIRAMKRALQTKRHEPNAMYRKEIGKIGFYYGAHNPATKTRKRSGHGLAHVVGSAKEDYGTYEGSPAPEEVLSIIPEVILDGEISRSRHHRIQIKHKRHLVILNEAGKRKDAPHWLFHAYRLYPKK